MERIDDQGTAHGLRQHSIGRTYPAVIVAHPLAEDINKTGWYVQFMGHRTVSLPRGAAHRAAENIARIYREHGYETAVHRFTNSIIYKGKVTR